MKKYMRQVRTEERGGLGYRDGGGRCGIVSEENEVRFGWPAIWGTHDDLGNPGEEHVWNELPDGSILDATRDQFGDRTGHGVRIIRPQDPEYLKYRQDTDPASADAPASAAQPAYVPTVEFPQPMPGKPDTPSKAASSRRPGTPNSRRRRPRTRPGIS